MNINLRRIISEVIQNPVKALNFIVNLPKLFRLYARLFKDPRTPLHLKLMLIFAIIYVLSPIDFLPDLLLPIFGLVDDVIILIIAAQYFLKKCPPEIVSEHMQEISSESVR